MAFPGIRRETSIDLQTEYGYWSDRNRTAPAKNGFVQLRNKLLRTPPSLHALALLEYSHRFFETATHQIERSGQSRDLIAAVRGQFGDRKSTRLNSQSP